MVLQKIHSGPFEIVKKNIFLKSNSLLLSCNFLMDHTCNAIQMRTIEPINEIP